MIGKQVRLTQQQDQKLRLIAKLQNSSQSKVVRDAIDALPENDIETSEATNKAADTPATNW
jgi:hypothetical protein